MTRHLMRPGPADPVIGLLTQRLAPGVWGLDTANLESVTSLANELGWTTASIRVGDEPDKAELLRRLSESVGFPSYYRANWDATADCLKDLPGPFSTPWLLVIDGRDLADVPGDVVTLLDVIAEASAFRRAHRSMLSALWIGPRHQLAPSLHDL